MELKSLLRNSSSLILLSLQSFVMMLGKQNNWWVSVKILRVVQYGALSLVALSSTGMQRIWLQWKEMPVQRKQCNKKWRKRNQATTMSILCPVLGSQGTLCLNLTTQDRMKKEWATNSIKALDKVPTQLSKKKNHDTKEILLLDSEWAKTPNSSILYSLPFRVLASYQMCQLRMSSHQQNWKTWEIVHSSIP